MKHRFYRTTQAARNRIQAIIAISAMMGGSLAIVLSVISGFYWIGILICAIILSIIAPFFDTPALKKSGKLIYYSPLFITEKPKNGVIKIHGGTLFDYFFVIDKRMNGKQRTNFILQQYLHGLLYFMEKSEDRKETDFKMRGTSYIINRRTAEKIGFKIVETDFSQKLILCFNYVPILISNSMAKKKVSFPNLNKTKTFEANFSQLLDRKEYLVALNNRLKNNS